jgi:alpha-L-rhamnosidase
MLTYVVMTDFRSILALVALGALSSRAIADIRCTHLLCEERSSPMGLDVLHPQLSWQLVDTESTERDQTQTAYRIQVATTRELLEEGRPDLWDSGRVLSPRTTQVEYRGSKLQSGRAYYWHVVVWDRNGHSSLWSPTATWSMGLLHSTDWRARWIGDPTLADPANRPLTPIHCYRSNLSSRPDANKWIVLDLGKKQAIDGAEMAPARPLNQNGDFRTPMFPVRFRIDLSDDLAFTDAHTVVDQTESDYPSPRTNSCGFHFNAAEGRYIRLSTTRLAQWDGQEYGIALAGFSALSGNRSLPVSDVRCSDSIENDRWSKRYLLTRPSQVALADDSPAVAAGVADVPARNQVSRVPMLRREFSVLGAVKRATLYSTARGFYELRINGQRVSDEQLAPGFTDYHVRLEVQAHDVTSLLRPGRNAIGALLGYGWYAGHMNLFDNRCIYGYFPQLLAQVDIELTNGKHMIVATDRRWRSTLNGPIRWSDLLDGEGYDARRNLPGWDRIGFNDRNWKPVWSQPRDATALVWPRCQPVRVVGLLRPVSVRAVGKGAYVFDFGQEIAGWCRLKASASSGTHVRLRHAELVGKDGNIDVGNLWGTPQQEDYLLAGSKRQTLEPHFTYHGFRYVELSGFMGKLRPDTLLAVNVRSDLAVTGHFECSNPLYNQIQRAAFWTQANLLFDVPAGCAARSERLAWTGDIRPCVPALLFNFDAAPLLTKYAQDLRDDQTKLGRFTDICPHAHLSGTDTCVGSPGWADAGVSLPWQTYVYTGDRQLLAQHYEAAKRWVDFIHANNPDLIWRNGRGMDWGDWLSAGPATPKELGATAFFARSADLVSQMAGVLGHKSDEKAYRRLFRDIRIAFVQKYASELGDIQGSAALALRFGLLDNEPSMQLAKRLAQLVEMNHHHPTTGFWSSSELLIALSDWGQRREAANAVNQTSEPSWGYMAQHGTTMWEAFDANSKNLSLNHWTHSAVSEWLWLNVAGIKPDQAQPGFQQFFIHPRPTKEVTWCRSSYDSIRGKIVCNWKISATRFTMDLTVPVNTTAIVEIPCADPNLITESGHIWRAGEYDSLEAKLQLGSGFYHISSPLTLAPTK